MKTYTSEEILKNEDLYELQSEFCSCAVPFRYKMTESEYEWAKFIEGKYSISDFVLRNTDTDLILSFNCPFELNKALSDDGMSPKAVMLSEDTALQKLFFWLADLD